MGLNQRSLLILSVLIITPAGFLSKFYSGPAHQWFNNYFAGVLYEVFWCLVVFFFWHDRKYITKIAIGVFTVTSLLEILQLWHPWILEQIRSTFMGRTLIGTTFSWWDFPHYVLGCIIGWFWMQRV
ncbi:MAG: DUF2809 domain-containing protein [bacterium]